jgi:superfamily II DNA or RNA helicase
VIVNGENKGKFNNNIITITTYQTYLLNVDDIDKLNYDLIIYDEAHHLLSETFKKSIYAVSDKKLFMTATKKIYKKLEDLSEDNEQHTNYFDMSDPIFGETIYKIDIEEGILKGYLTDYKIYLGEWGEDVCDMITK